MSNINLFKRNIGIFCKDLSSLEYYRNQIIQDTPPDIIDCCVGNVLKLKDGTCCYFYPGGHTAHGNAFHEIFMEASIENPSYESILISSALRHGELWVFENIDDIYYRHNRYVSVHRDFIEHKFDSGGVKNRLIVEGKADKLVIDISVNVNVAVAKKKKKKKGTKT